MTTTIQSTPVKKSVLSGPDGGDWARAFFPYWLDGVMAVGWYPVELAQTSNLAGTYTGATGGAPGYLTVTATGALSVDSVAVAVGDRILLQNQSTGAERGVFDVTVAGGSGVHPVLTRSQDASASGDFQRGKVVSVAKGTGNGGKTYYCGFTPPFVLETGTPTFTATAANVTFTSVNSALAAADAPIDVNAEPINNVGAGSAGSAARKGDTTSASGTGASGGTAPAFTGAAPGAAMANTITGFTGTTTGKVTTISLGGAVVAAHALAGGTVTDGTTETRIADNSALTATTGTITTVTALAATITATGSVFYPTVPVGTVASHTHTGPSHTHTNG